MGCQREALSWDSAGPTGTPGVPILGRGISPRGNIGMRQVRTLSASTRRVDVDGVVERPDQSLDEGVMAL